MASYVQRIIIGLYLILALGCATPQISMEVEIMGGVVNELNNNGLSCDKPEGREYTCYSFEECLDYFSAYGAVLKEKFDAQERGFFLDGNPDVQTVDINLFDAHTNIYVIGRHTGTRVGNRVWIFTETIACDVELNQIAPYTSMEGWAEWTVWNGNKSMGPDKSPKEPIR